MKRSLLAEVSGVVEAPPERVRESLVKSLIPNGVPNGMPGGVSGGVPGEGRFTVEDWPGHTLTVEVTDRSIAYQGGWWYRGEWSHSGHPQGTLVVHQVYNVAKRLRWAVPLANRFFIGFDEATREGFAKGLARIGEDLGCSVRLA
ncbi:hypothetical protein [Nonomuraea sp. NEAU-A123]|uniref:hypothetical protein n=1 Tax=Nonomuraea sp. NEAU-A123 TaxID=2839649 RepID=UPI001BE4D2BE|nr:hypothetical protein [Nonomuraea sp. NEAU-A123]MBT2226496.1 hypothetical protein [Nonomuraea sp. NEAU-A123]